MNMNSGTAVSANVFMLPQLIRPRPLSAGNAALHQQVDDRRHCDRERHRHPGGEQAEEDQRDDDDLQFRTEHGSACGSAAHARGTS